ncbi:trigger factor [Collinsella sp. zg1085]|uniref:trigger factor n=1 Tax=Collinsella sp. zg1085 TaxID=2844380 RepID=UPI001C0CFC2D|nr:trigger factor [Collinsella sp. zg1085]QWT18202.1 trigger factor [Collinsella sp. zg1085]
MNISASDVQDAKLTATVTIPADEVDAAIKTAFRAAAKQYRFPGFRAGKAPRKVVESMVGKDFVLGQATNEILAKNEPKILNELDIVPLKDANYQDLESVQDHTDYTYTVEFSLRPAPALSSYDPVSIEMPPAEVTEAEVEAQIELVLDYQSKFVDVDRAVEDQDFVRVDIKNLENAESFEGENQLLHLGSTSQPKEFDQALLGAKLGDVKEVSWTHEHHHEHDDEHAHEHAHHHKVELTVKAIQVRQAPELSEESVKELFGYDNIAAMREAVKEDLAKDKESRLPQLKENRVVSKLAERLELEEMDADYEQSVFQELGQNFMQNLSAQGINLDMWLQINGLSSDQFIADLHRQAHDVARESLALDALARERAVEVSEDDLVAAFESAGIEDIAASRAEFEAQGRMPGIRDSIRRSKAVDWLVETAEITEVDTFAESEDKDEESADTE